MKRQLPIIAAFALFLSTPGLSSAQDSVASRLRWGIGLSLQPDIRVEFEADPAFAPFEPGEILVPIRWGTRTILEPEVGYLRSRSEATQNDLALTQTSTTTRLRVGAGVLREIWVRPAFAPYFGARLGLVRTKVLEVTTGSSGSSEVERLQSTVFGSAIFGAQRFFGDHFSLGAEARFTTASLGQTRIDPDPPGDVRRGQTVVSVNAALAMRLYVR